MKETHQASTDMEATGEFPVYNPDNPEAKSRHFKPGDEVNVLINPRAEKSRQMDYGQWKVVDYMPSGQVHVERIVPLPNDLNSYVVSENDLIAWQKIKNFRKESHGRAPWLLNSQKKPPHTTRAHWV